MDECKNPEILQKVAEIISCIQNDPIYKRYLELKKVMEEDRELLKEIEEIKQLEKRLVQVEQKGDQIKKRELQKEFDLHVKSLEQDILYQEFIEHQEKINETLANVQFLIQNFFEKKINP